MASVKEKVEEYFSTMNPIATRMMDDMKTVMEEFNEEWEEFSLEEKSCLLWRSVVKANVEEKYICDESSEKSVECFPVLDIKMGEKIIVDEDTSNGKPFGCTWRDEHSAPFMWETQSQLDLRLFAVNDTPTSLRKKQHSIKTLDLEKNNRCITVDSEPERFDSSDLDSLTPKNTRKKSLPPGESSSTSLQMPVLITDKIQHDCNVSVSSSKETLTFEKEPETVEPPTELEQKPDYKFEENAKDLEEISDDVDLDVNAEYISRSDLSSPSQFIPKSGFDFLDNW
ncbi:uncharacterized protein C1orf198 homolog [Limulus polyphemus]|uniref:Uncharacterized protein C1orf198 homolog n=1 Tax=Limulus polyphemus TaxID=6850 RepID=A0ABM1BP05_LIMPO|nr:uncharacterized protein C1orf198 homolog [Limulus polyphemus]